jgi:phenylalanyl-tRNA synthetase alpha chain
VLQLDEITALSLAAVEAIGRADSLESLKQVEIDSVGKKAPITLVGQQLGSLSAEDKKIFGAALQEARSDVGRALAERRSTLTDSARRAQLENERLDLTEKVASEGNGRVHLITQTIHDLEDIFLGMGFSVFNGPEVETDWYNFEALNFPKAHPARTMHDTFYLNLGEAEEVVLRTHTSPMQIRVMQEMKPPIYAVMPGRCYRRDTADARHLPVFHQIEALVIDKGISLGHLAGTIETFIRAYFGKDLKARLRPGFFPFTEPSAEFEITCPFCGGDGCKTCSQTGWIELGGCGMVHPNVLKAGGIDSEEYTGFAWGFGIDRLAMNRHNIEDLRMFVDNDIRLLRQF